MNHAIVSAADTATFSVVVVNEPGRFRRSYIRNDYFTKYCGARKVWADYASSETADGNAPTSALKQHKNLFRITSRSSRRLRQLIISIVEIASM
jgi:hypothetical protein